MKSVSTMLVALALVGTAVSSPAQMPAPAASSAAALPTGILQREQAGSVLPATVFFRGQTAAIQMRNAAGVKFGDGKLILAALVDASGYASTIQEVYQGYLIVERPVLFAGKRLTPGAYGFGFLQGDQAVVLDVGGTPVLHGPTTRDPDLKRPTPLQILADSHPHQYRLYLGRSYVTLAAGE